MKSPIFVLALVLTAAVGAHGQTAIDPTGHWEGTVQLPDMPIVIEVDITKSANGALAGTYGQPADGLQGFPLSSVSVEGQTVRFLLKAGEAPARFEGTLARDGKTISGTAQQGAFEVSFNMSRTGDAKVIAVAKSAAIGKELEGTWKGAMDVQGRTMHIVFTMANQSDGSSSGTVMSVDGSGVEIPIAIAQNGKKVTLDVPQVRASFAGELTADGTELAGSWQQQGLSLPLKLHRDR